MVISGPAGWMLEVVSRRGEKNMDFFILPLPTSACRIHSVQIHKVSLFSFERWWSEEPHTQETLTLTSLSVINLWKFKNKIPRSISQLKEESTVPSSGDLRKCKKCGCCQTWGRNYLTCVIIWKRVNENNKKTISLCFGEEPMII